MRVECVRLGFEMFINSGAALFKRGDNLAVRQQCFFIAIGAYDWDFTCVQEAMPAR